MRNPDHDFSDDIEQFALVDVYIVPGYVRQVRVIRVEARRAADSFRDELRRRRI